MPDNSGLAQLGFQANFKVGFVLESSVLNRYIWLTKSPTDAKPQDVIGQQFSDGENTQKKTIQFFENRRKIVVF